MEVTRLISFLGLVILTMYFSTFSSCSKEYSYEGGFTRDTIIVKDTLSTDTTILVDTTKIDSTLNIPKCTACDSTKPLALNSWSFKFNNSYVCGVVENSFLNIEKNSFALRGHLQCSRDTIFRMLAFSYPLEFTADRFDVSTTSQTFIFQDRINSMNSSGGDILRTNGLVPKHTLKVVVDTFNISTKLMVGRFKGYAYTKNKEKTYIDGRFRVIVQ